MFKCDDCEMFTDQTYKVTVDNTPTKRVCNSCLISVMTLALNRRKATQDNLIERIRAVENQLEDIHDTLRVIKRQLCI